MRQASAADLDLLVGLMAEFYAESSYPLNLRRAAEAFRESSLAAPTHAAG